MRLRPLGNTRGKKPQIKTPCLSAWSGNLEVPQSKDELPTIQQPNLNHHEPDHAVTMNCYKVHGSYSTTGLHPHQNKNLPHVRLFCFLLCHVGSQSCGIPLVSTKYNMNYSEAFLDKKIVLCLFISVIVFVSNTHIIWFDSYCTEETSNLISCL